MRSLSQPTGLPGGTGNVKVSGAMVAGGNVFQSGFLWSPDSSRLAYRADQDTDNVIELYTVTAAGTARVKVSGPLVTGGAISSFRWSPDSSRLAYRADQDTDGVIELYSALADDTGNTRVSGEPVGTADVVSFAWE